MEEKFSEYCKKLLREKNVLPVYKNLCSDYEKKGYYKEYISGLEKIWHISKRPELLLQAGDTAAMYISDYNLAYYFYDLYFQYTNPALYSRFMFTLKQKGYDGLPQDFDNTCYFSELAKYTDRYIAIVEMLVYLHKETKYDEIIALKHYLNEILDQINEYSEKHPGDDYPFGSKVWETGNYLSGILSQTEHRNDINEFAIELNSKNERAYNNIIFDFLMYQNYAQALSFYNDRYCKEFDAGNFDSVVNLCWNYSDKFAQQNDFFKAVQCQKIAIDIELDNKK